MFDGFEEFDIVTTGTTIHVRQAGQAPQRPATAIAATAGPRADATSRSLTHKRERQEVFR